MVYKLYFSSAFLGAVNFLSIIFVTVVFFLIFKKYIAASRQPARS